MSRLNLTSWQRQRLRRQLTETADARLFRRIVAVVEFDYGRSAADLARMLGVTRQSVYNWIETYTQDHDPAALQDDPGRGRHPALDEDEQHLLEALLAVSPQQLGYPHVSWTMPLLQDVLEIATERRLSDDTLRRALHRLDFGWKRPRHDLDPDPQREKKRRIRRQIGALPRRSVVLAEDETDLLLFPPLRAGWSKRGEVAKIWVS